MTWLPHVFVAVGIAYIVIAAIRFRDRHGYLLQEIERTNRDRFDAEEQTRVEERRKVEEFDKLTEAEDTWAKAKARIEEIKDQIRQADELEEALSMQLYKVSKGKES